MYPPQSQYSRLATDPEHADIPVVPAKKLTATLRPWLRPAAIIGTTLFLIMLVLGHYGAFNDVFATPSEVVPHEKVEALPNKTEPIPNNKPDDFPNEMSFAFDMDSRPTWLDAPPVGGPVALRIAVISRPGEFDRRQALRESVFLGVPESDVTMDFLFFVGATMESETETRLRLARENKKYGDVVVLEDIDDIPERLSEKRYAAMKWAGTAPHDSYDYFMTIDSDTFVRFGALARRMPSFLKDRNVKPRQQPVLIGRLSDHVTYFLNTVPDGNPDPSREDEHIRGPWYSYPAGIGYMLSSSLVNTLLSIDPPLAHHIHYPSDDVMIGSWIASLRYFPDKSIEFTEPTPEDSEELGRKVIPKPYLPEPVDTIIIDDKEGWHDFIGRGGHAASFTLNSVCVHHVTGDEMEKFREMDTIKGEWDL